MARKQPPLVGIVMGSESDWPIMQAAVATLEEFRIPCERRLISAHRTPEAAREFAQGAAGRGLRVIIAGAGRAAHLAGAIAAHTPLPVIGVPLESGALSGLDALLSTVQMPNGVPVATVAVGGAMNAALLAVQILGAADPAVRDRVIAYKAKLRDAVLAADAKLNAGGAA
jgi:5-(carboxyamino)imidazole ribonucleotide mutase